MRDCISKETEQLGSIEPKELATSMVQTNSILTIGTAETKEMESSAISIHDTDAKTSKGKTAIGEELEQQKSVATMPRELTVVNVELGVVQIIDVEPTTGSDDIRRT
jgi:hypothetical protein